MLNDDLLGDPAAVELAEFIAGNVESVAAKVNKRNIFPKKARKNVMQVTHQGRIVVGG